jgi:acyl-CoA dehydrogenase
MHSDGGEVRFRREAPVVSGGAHADGFLVTVRRSATAAPEDVVLVYCSRWQSGARVTAVLDMLGMRASGNVALRLDVAVPVGQVIDPPGGFARITMRSMAPLGHLGWAACWIGAVRALLRSVIRLVRRAPAGQPAIARTDAVFEGLARVRCQLDTAEALLGGALREYRSRSGSALETADFQILINNVKVVVAEQTYAAVDRLLELTGMGLGYRRDSQIPVERVFRDLRSASLMYGNGRLLHASGRLALMDRRAESFVASGAGLGPEGSLS